MLIGEQCGGNQYRDLLTVLHRLERGPHRDLRLAVADVATDHAVHRDGLFHIGFDFGDRGQLIDGLGEPEGVLHFGLPRCVGRERVARRGLSLGIEGDKLTSDLTNRLARLGFCIGPVTAAEATEAGLLTADVAGELIERVHRYEKPIGLLAALTGGVFQNEVLPPGAADGALDHLDEPADAVLVMHHQITGGQGQWVHGVSAFGGQPFTLGPGGPVAGEVGLGDHHQLGTGNDDAVVQRTLEHVHDAQAQRRTRFEHRGGGIPFTKLLNHPVRCSDSRGDDGGPATGEHVGAQHGENLVGAALLTAGRRGRSQVEIYRTGLTELADRPPLMTSATSEVTNLIEIAETGASELLDVDRGVTADRSHRPGGFEELLSGLDQVRGSSPDLLRVAHQQWCTRRQMVDEEAESLRVQYRGQCLHAVDRDSLSEFGEHVTDAAGDVVVARGRIGGQCGCASAHFVSQQQLTARHGDDRADLDFRDRTLIGDREHPYLSDLIAPELHPHRVLGGGREDVKDAAAYRELPAAAHHVDPGVGQFDQARSQVVEVHLGPHPQGHRLDFRQTDGHRLQQRAHRRHHHRQRRSQIGIVGTCQSAQQQHPSAHRVHTGRQPLMGKGLPGREQRRGIAVHATQLRSQIVGLATGRGDHEQGAGSRQRAGHEQLRGGRPDQTQLIGTSRGQLGQLDEFRRLQNRLDKTLQRGVDMLVPRCGHDVLILGNSDKNPCGGKRFDRCYSPCNAGSASRWLRPFHIRFTRCAATTSLAGSRASSHHCAVIDTEPTSAWAYSGANSGSSPRRAKSSARIEDTWLTASLSRLE